MFNKITIIGCGLIGSSLIRAINKKSLSKQINIFDKSKEVSGFIKSNFTVNVFTDISESVKESDLVIIASPLSSYKEILLSIKSSLKKNVILTDTGSAKKEVNKVINNLNLENIYWIASHPIAGTEFSGPEAGFAELFDNRWCILSSENQKAKEQIDRLKLFWESIGCKVKFMTFKDNVVNIFIKHFYKKNIVKKNINTFEDMVLKIDEKNFKL